MRRATGPFTLSINDETGLLIDGFDTPPYLMMGHVPRYYGPRVEEQGYRKARDLIAYAFDVAAPPPPRARRMLERLSKGAGLSFRPIDMRRFDQELQTIVDIFNDAWSDNWGFVPMTPAEVRYMGKNLKPIVRAEYAWIGEVDGEPAAMTVTLPNLNEAIADLRGRLLPFGWAKLLWRLKVRGTRTRAHAAHGRAQEVSGHAARRGPGARRDRGGAQLARRSTAPRRPSCPGCSRTTGRPTTSSSWSAAARTRPTGSTRSRWRERWPGARARRAVHRAGARRQPRPGRSGRHGPRASRTSASLPVAGVPMVVRVVETLAASPSDRPDRRRAGGSGAAR